MILNVSDIARFSHVGKIPDDHGFYCCRPSQILPICKENHGSLQKTGMLRENRKAPYFPDLSPIIPDDQGCLHVSISQQNLG